MKIIVNKDYNVIIDNNLLGYVGETNARYIFIEQPEISEADTYRLRLDYGDNIVYDVYIQEGKVLITGSLLPKSGQVKCQWLATAADGESYKLVAKSNIFYMRINDSISDDVAPVPSYEESIKALDKVLNLENEAESAAQAAAESAQTAADKASEIAASAEQIAENAVEIEDVKAYIGYTDEDIVGLCVDYENKMFTRLAGAVGKNQGEDFDFFPMYGGRRRCNVADDGTINAYNGDQNYTEDGTNGQVMVYQPKFYYKVVPLKLDKNKESGLGYHIRKANYYVSTTPKAGFKLHPAFYDESGNEIDYILLSAYEGSMFDASADAYVNDSVDESIAYAEGDLLCSVAGKKPISGLRSGMGTKANFEKMAQNRGSGWHLETIKATSANQLLMIVELGTMNTQTGISKGVVTISDNSAYNCSSLTGSTADLGNGTGAATETINEIGGAETTYNTAGNVSVSYRGVENPWGNIWKHIQGVNIWGDGTMCGGQPYIANDFTFNESKNSDNYEPVGFTLANASGYINAMGYGGEDFDWLLMPSEIGGTSALPVGDYTYVTANLNGYRVALLGGFWSYGAIGGGFCWHCDSGVGGRHRIVGGRLVYVPTKDSAAYTAAIASWESQKFESNA